MQFTIETAGKFLRNAELFDFEDEDEEDEWANKWHQTLNLSDTFAWACADAQFVEDVELPELARLFYDYGYCGVLYWVSEKRKNENGPMMSEFHDINRHIQFVRIEEELRNAEPYSTKRAFKKVEYTIGVTDNKEKK